MKTAKKPHPVTIRDLAAQTGVSPATVSRVVNQRGYVSEATRRRIETAIKQMGYRPDARARALRGMPSGLIALVIPSILNVFYTTLAQAVENKLRPLGYTMLLGVTEDDPALYLSYLNQFSELKVDGIICVPPPHSQCAPTIQSLLERGVSMVEVNRRHQDRCLDAVLADNLQGARTATNYLLSLGHRRIALIIGSPDTTTGKDRLDGFQWTMAAAGVEVDPSLVKIGSFTKEFGIAATRELMELVPRPTAIMTTSNRLLMGTMTVLAEQHIRVPDDLSIVSFDDSEWLSFWQPPITTVDIAVDEMGALAVELVLRSMNSEAPRDMPHTYSLGTTLIERQSCGRIAPSINEA